MRLVHLMPPIKTELSYLIQQEVAKYLQDKNTIIQSPQAHFAQTYFAGNSMSQNFVLQSVVSPRNSWILDTGASNHMCNDLSLLHDVQCVKPPIFAKWDDSGG